MYNFINSASIIGLQSSIVKVEVDFSQGLPCFSMVGNLSSEVKESSERVRISLKNIGILIPPARTTINISPADLRKTGTGFDLPIALGILINLGKIEASSVESFLIIGELGLDGSVKKINGVMPMILDASKQGFKKCIVPYDNASEAALVPDMKVTGVKNLFELIEYLNTSEEIRDDVIPPATCDDNSDLISANDKITLDFVDVVGQDSLKRGAIIAAAGFHHLLFMGPPGTGKSMIARRIPTIMPPLTSSESMDVTALYSIAGKLTPAEPVKKIRPFISPHHTITPYGMAGGGNNPKPGAVSLAHKGILFLDELPEFKRQTIDMLRQPLEEKTINIARANGSYNYPADIMLVAAMNPCPCGFFPDRNKCSCTPFYINQYLSHISGPILDRIDMCLTATKIDIKDLQNNSSSSNSESMLKEVLTARNMQLRRNYLNSSLSQSQIDKYCNLDTSLKSFTEKICSKLDLSARGYHRLLKVSRTIADLEESENIKKHHIEEALGYRLMLPKA